MLTPILKAHCPAARAGLLRLWAVACRDVVDVFYFETTHQVHNVVLAPGASWTQIEFSRLAGAYLLQEKVVARTEPFVRQSIYFELPGLNADFRKALYDLNAECCLNVIVQDEAGKFHYCGISLEATDGEENFMHEDMRTGDGSSETGADPLVDYAHYSETLVALCEFYAPLTFSPDDFSSLFWTKPDDQYWTKFDGTYWTIKV